MKPPLVAIAGPTASGKSALALRLAQERNGVIINADASQVYGCLRIVTARPTKGEEAQAPHRLYGVVDPSDACSAATWAGMARAEVRAAWEAGRLPILVGGTGLYLRTLLDGVAPVPEINPAIRAAVRALPPTEVRAALEAEDPAVAARLHPNDPQRNARALEVVRATGRSLLHWQSLPGDGLGPEAALEGLVVTLPRTQLHARADARVVAMLAAGALEEVRALAARGLIDTLPAMRAIGVPPLLAYLRGELSLGAALERWKLDTRHYIKRQETWFRNQMSSWQCIDPGAAT